MGVGEVLTPHLAQAPTCCPDEAGGATPAPLPRRAKVFSVLSGCSQSAARTIQTFPVKDHAHLHAASRGGSTSTERWRMQHGFLPQVFSFCLILTAVVAAAGTEPSVPKQEWDL